MATAAPFDYCVVTASTPAQAELYKGLVQRRISCGMYPESLKFRFYADPPKGRIGSGGGTLVALNELLKEETGGPAVGSDGLDESKVKTFFGEKRVLVLHAGGESRRLPCYVPEGKLFGPLSMPSDASATCPPVVLDLVLSLYFKYPWVPGEVLLASGDVIVDFSTTAFEKDFARGSICGFGVPAPLEQGSHHGVFAFPPSSGTTASTLAVSDFHQKSPVSVLQKECLVPGTTDKCALDMGIFTMNVDWCLAFFRVAASHCAKTKSTVMAAVDEAQLYWDFYMEGAIASLPKQTKDQYMKRMKNASTKLPDPILETMHKCLSGLEFRGALVSEAMFLHFGTLREFPEASAESGTKGLLPFYTKGSSSSAQAEGFEKTADGVMLVNCALGTVKVAREVVDSPAETKDCAWVEMCSGLTATLSPAGFHILIGLCDITLPDPLPAGICLDGRRAPALAAGQIVAVYSVSDTFKAVKTPGEVKFCGTSFPEWLKARELTANDVWEADNAKTATDFWTAKLFIESPSPDFLKGYWDVDFFSKTAFMEAKRFSIGELNLNDSVLARDELRSKFFADTLAAKAPSSCVIS